MGVFLAVMVLIVFVRYFLLRDLLAMFVVVGLMANSHGWRDVKGQRRNTGADYANMAYELADAMLCAREKKL